MKLIPNLRNVGLKVDTGKGSHRDMRKIGHVVKFYKANYQKP